MRNKKSCTFHEGLFIRRKVLQCLLNALAVEGILPDDDCFKVLLYYLAQDELMALAKRGSAKVSGLVRHDTPEEEVDLQRLAVFMARSWRSIYSRATRLEMLQPFHAVLETLNMEKAQRDLLQKRLAEVRRIFRLKESETEILLLLFLLREHRQFRLAYDGFHGSHAFLNRNRSVNLICACTALASHSVRAALASDAPLRRYGLLDNDWDLSLDIADFLAGIGTRTLASAYYRKFDGTAAGIEAHANLAPHIGAVAH